MSSSSWFTYSDVKIDDMIIDLDVQRPIDENNPVLKAQRNRTLDTSAIGTIIVSKRGDGKYVIIDGQHRVLALTREGKGNQTVTCEVYHGLTKQQEAKIFRLRNASRSVSTIDKFRVRVTEEDPVAVDLLTIINNCGWSLPGNNLPPFYAVATLERIYKSTNGRHIAETTLHTVTCAWKHIQDAVDYRILSGVAAVLKRYEEAIDSKNFVLKLSELVPGIIIENAKGFQKVQDDNITNCVAALIIKHYNKGKSRRVGSKRLPDWYMATPSTEEYFVE